MDIMYSALINPSITDDWRIDSKETRAIETTEGARPVKNNVLRCAKYNAIECHLDLINECMFAHFLTLKDSLRFSSILCY